MIKTEEQNETAIDMLNDEFHLIMEQDFSAINNANEKNKAENISEEDEADSDATEIDDEVYAAFSGEWFACFHFLF